MQKPPRPTRLFVAAAFALLAHTVAAAPSRGRWIWFPEGKPASSAPAGVRYFRGKVTLPAGAKVRSARLSLTIDDSGTLHLNGKIVAAAKVSFQVSKTLITTCQRKYERSKVWFELYHASKDYFWEPKWELCGETYDFFEEPSGEEIVIGTEIVPPPLPPAADNEDNDDNYEQALVW